LRNVLCKDRSALRQPGRSLFHWVMALLALQPVGLAASEEKRAAPALSAEDKEILKYRDLLENFELLQNLEKIKYLDFFTEKKPKGKESNGTKSPGKDNAQKQSTPKPK
jgi:hypothetical protein